MKWNILITAFLLLPSYAFCESERTLILKTHIPKSDKYTKVVTYSDEGQHLKQQVGTRNVDYPTQVIRIKNNIEDLKVNCDDVHNEINDLLVSAIVNDNFTYSIYISCRFAPETKLAIEFRINSYFDPLNEEAITFLESYLSKYNGSILLGTEYKIEAAKGLIISLNLAAGMKEDPRSSPFIQYKAERNNFYFKSNYEMKNKLYNDIVDNFFTPNPDKILPFLDKWIAPYASSYYKSILENSNYVELQPEKIFVMDNESIFVSILKEYFIHFCEEYENHRCLTPT